MITIHNAPQISRAWLDRYQGQPCLFVTVLGFTETALIEGISTAGGTPQAREFTAIADGEFLAHGNTVKPSHPLPKLEHGVSPAFISRAVIETCAMDYQIFNTGLPHPVHFSVTPVGPAIGKSIVTGQALTPGETEMLLVQGIQWGERLATASPDGYLVIGECVVGGTTTALGLLTALGIDAAGKVNSSYHQCNHSQKQALVTQGLAGLTIPLSPLAAVAAVGDPMQVFVAGLAIGASKDLGILLAGGTQMLAVYALLHRLNGEGAYAIDFNQIVVGTTPWVIHDPTGATIALAKLTNDAPLLSANLDFSQSRLDTLRAYEAGYVKEGVGAGGAAIAAMVSHGLHPHTLLTKIESLVDQYF